MTLNEHAEEQSALRNHTIAIYGDNSITEGLLNSGNIQHPIGSVIEVAAFNPTNTTYNINSSTFQVFGHSSTAGAGNASLCNVSFSNSSSCSSRNGVELDSVSKTFLLSLVTLGVIFNFF